MKKSITYVILGNFIKLAGRMVELPQPKGCPDARLTAPSHSFSRLRYNFSDGARSKAGRAGRYPAESGELAEPCVLVPPMAGMGLVVSLFSGTGTAVDSSTKPDSPLVAFLSTHSSFSSAHSFLIAWPGNLW